MQEEKRSEDNQQRPELTSIRKDFIPYFKSMTDELDVIRNRVRQLVKHWPSDGYFKESILRQYLRKHLPESVIIGSGFVVNVEKASGEIDILIVDRNMPTLFKEDDLLIVTPESVRAVIEVKSRLDSPSDIKKALLQIAERKAIVTRHVSCKDVWAGLFVFDGVGDRHEDILNALYESYWETNTIVDCVSYGKETIVKFFDTPAVDGGQWPDNSWHSFHMPDVAPSNFVASLIEKLVPDRRDPGSFAWFCPPNGFEGRYFIRTSRDATVKKLKEWTTENPRPLPSFLNIPGETQ